jgi:multidrug efflux pump subunit AcrA (membrane-fusion protein)
MKTLLKSLLMLVLIVGVSCSKDKEKAEIKESKIESYYTCSMHPQIKEQKSGKCPLCHMNLTKVEVDQSDEVQVTKKEELRPFWRCENFPDVTSEGKTVCPIDGTPMVKVDPYKERAGEVVARVKLRKAQLSHFNPDFFPVSKMKMTKTISLLGNVIQSEEKESNIPARIAGRIEKVYVKSTGELIKANQLVLELYSPRLITGGEEYILARKSFKENGSQEYRELVKESEEKLKLWGIRKFQMERWYRSGKVPRSIKIYSPTSGIVRKRNAIKGKYFKEGQSFFDLADLSDVWVELDVYESDSALVSIGQEVTLKFQALPGKVLKGAIDFVDPVINLKTRTLKVRATISNSEGLLKPGMVADGSLKIALDQEPLVVPRTAIIDTGKRKVIWSKVSNKLYQAKEIYTGFESEGYVEVVKGLMAGEEVVIEGNFLLDAQAQLFGGYE